MPVCLTGMALGRLLKAFVLNEDVCGMQCEYMRGSLSVTHTDLCHPPPSNVCSVLIPSLNANICMCLYTSVMEPTMQLAL